MKRQPYFPKNQAQQPEWLFNYADRVDELGEGMGLVDTAIAATVNDARHSGYAIGAWLTKVREFGPGCTSQVQELLHGTGSGPFTLPEFEAPAPPAGLTAVLPGALDRIFKYVKVIKAAPGYTEGKGLLIGIVGAEDTSDLGTNSGGGGGGNDGTQAPRIKDITSIPGTTHQRASIRFYKDGHEYLQFESRRNGGAWEGIGMSKKSPFIDDRPLAVAGQAEVREYRARYFDNGQPNGDWSPVVKTTIAP